MALLPRDISSLKCRIVWLAVLPDALWDGFIPWKDSTVLHAEDVVACGARGPAISFNEWMNPVESPEHICGEKRRMWGAPILVDQ